jgi:hypothetical protein
MTVWPVCGQDAVFLPACFFWVLFTSLRSPSLAVSAASLTPNSFENHSEQTWHPALSKK